MPEITSHVIFDLDGTLVDSAPGVVWAIRTAWNLVCPHMPLPEVRQFIGPPIRKIFQLAAPNLDGTTMQSLIEHYRQAYDSEGWRQTSVYPGALAALANLKQAGVGCWGVTNKPALPTRLILEHCDLRQFFREFLSINSRTPPFASKAEATRTLIARHGIIVSATLFVGDTPEDAHAAAECGLRFLAFRGGYGWPELQQHIPGYRSFASYELMLECLLEAQIYQLPGKKK
jgi:phosphoglycolate phosphatase